jgi:lysyl-tRNA synthetase class 1
VSGGSTAQLERILRDFTEPEPITDLDETRPRLDRASEWVREHLSADERTVPRDEPDTEQLAALDDPSRQAVDLLLEHLDAMWSLPELTALVYGVPKLQRGLTLDAPPSDEIKVAQRAWFVTLYGLLINRDTGPRLPTLLLALGKDRIRRLLTA